MLLTIHHLLRASGRLGLAASQTNGCVPVPTSGIRIICTLLTPVVSRRQDPVHFIRLCVTLGCIGGDLRVSEQVVEVVVAALEHGWLRDGVHGRGFSS